MWIFLAIGLLAVWLGLKLVWGVASLAIHVLLAAAVIALIWHFVHKRVGRRDAPAGT